MVRQNDVPDDIRKKRDFEQKINKDRLVRLTQSKNYTTDEIIKEALVHAAREKAYLEILREDENLEIAERIVLSKKIADIVKQVGDLSLSLHRALSSNEVNVNSEGFKILFDLLLGKLDEAMDQARLDEEHKETIFVEFGKILENLEREYHKELKAQGKK